MSSLDDNRAPDKSREDRIETRGPLVHDQEIGTIHEEPDLPVQAPANGLARQHEARLDAARVAVDVELDDEEDDSPAAIASYGDQPGGIGLRPATDVGLAPFLPVDPGPARPPTLEEMNDWIGLYTDADQVIELRLLDVRDPLKPDNKPFTVSGFFDFQHLNELVQAACDLTHNAKGTYVTINPVDPELLALRGNRIEKYPKRTANDGDIIRRQLLLIDVDPHRISATTGQRITAEISATDAEKARARAKAEQIYQFVHEQGWPDPFAVDSGNGFQLLYLIDEPPDDEGLVQCCLQALAARFDGDGAEIDQKVFNTARIAKLPGTLARKGDNTAERPHRWARLLKTPETLQVVPHDLLVALAAEAPAAMAGTATAARTSTRAVTGTAGTPAIAQARDHLAGMPIAIEGESGSDRAFAATCALVVGFGLTIEEAKPLFTEYSDRCLPPWSEKEIEHKLADAQKKAEEAPGRVGYLLAKSSSPQGEDDPALDPYAGFAGDLPEPRRLRIDLLPVPPMATTILPLPFRDWLVDTAERVGCPLEYVAVASIIAVAAVVGRKVAIRPQRKDDWTVVPNLWGGIVGRPGEMKTPALEEALRPLRRLVKEAEEAYLKEASEFERKFTLEKLRFEAAKKGYQAALNAKTRDQDLIDKLEERIKNPPADTPPARKRYLVNDPTIEKLVEILRENPNGVLLFRDELIGWLRTLDKLGHETDRAFFLEGWNGTGSFTSDRIGRGTVHADAVCLSLLGGVQPGPLASYIRAAATGNGKEDDGLLSRLQVLVYPDPLPEWKLVDRYPDVEAKNRAFTIFERLASLDPAAVGAEASASPEELPFLRFTEEAQDLFDAWRARLENEKIRADDVPPLIESHLAKYRSLMPSLALLFHLLHVIDGGPAGAVSLGAAQRAAAWCDLLEAHVSRIYQASFDGDPEPVRRLAARIRKGAVKSPFTARQVAEHDWSGLATQDEVDRAVATLERYDWVRTVVISTGGRPKTLVFINPHLMKKDAS